VQLTGQNRTPKAPLKNLQPIMKHFRWPIQRCAYIYISMKLFTNFPILEIPASRSRCGMVFLINSIFFKALTFILLQQQAEQKANRAGSSVTTDNTTIKSV
jgi:hypothetical protein